MGRFFSNLKQKTIAGSTAPTSAQLRDTGQTIFIEKRNTEDLGELILVQKANILQHQNGRLQHPGLSALVSTTIPDSGTPTDVKPVPKNFEVYEIASLSIANATGGAAAVTIALTDGTNVAPIVSGLAVGAGATEILVSPLAFDGSTSSTNSPFTIDSSLRLMSSSDTAVTIQVGYRVFSVS